MREIKFRVWLGDRMDIVDSLYIDELGVNTKGINGAPCYRNYTNSILMQYTGLKDRIGTEIYEGDIVKIWGRGFTNKLGSGNAIVVFDEAQFAFYINEQYYHIWGDSCEMYEVIGNIYENPELLEVK